MTSTLGIRETTAIAAATFTLWYIIDPANIPVKIATVAFGALAVHANNWLGCTQRQSELNTLGKELYQWEALYQSFPFSKEPELYSDVSNKKYERGEDRWNTAKEQRQPVQEAAKNVIQELGFRYIKSGSKILEIGSNVLDNKGLSVLGRLLPITHLNYLTYSDYIPLVVKSEFKKSHKYKLLDIRNPSPSFLNSQDVLMAMNVLDVLAHHDLAKTAAGTHQILKKEGLAIILADRPIAITALNDKFSDASDFAFPWTEDVSLDQNATLLKGLNVISVDALRKIIHELGDEYKAFIEKIITLTPTQRHCFLENAFFKGFKLCEFLQLATENHCQQHERTLSYQNDVTAAFESHHFETLFSGYLKGQEVVNHNDPTYRKSHGQCYNTLSYDLRNGGPLVATRTRRLPEGEMLVTATFHVMVFKKKEAYGS